jgi:hypothetical protein
VTTGLHGREASLQVLRDRLASAHAGHGQLVLVSGEPGIGKSALAEAIAGEARARGADVTWGRAWEFAEAPPYFPMRPLVRALGIDASAELDDAGAFDLWERVLAALASAATSRTIVWLVEDIHAADLGTLDLLTFLGQPLRAMRVLVVATLRPHDARIDDRKLQRLARMARDGTELRLDPLGEDAIAAIAADMLGQPLPAPALHRLVELTGGNPLFTVECARAVRAGGVEHVLDRLPSTVRHVVLERVALLPAATRRLLEAGAVIGRELAATTLARMVGSDVPRVIDELLPALRAGVLRELRPTHFTFSHVVVRDAIEDALGADARARLHAAAEQALAGLGDHAEVIVERARHALAAAGSIDSKRVLALATRAAELLEREAAWDRAFELHTRIDDARAAGLLTPASGEERLHVASVAFEAGRSDVMRRICEAVLATARAARDHELFARAVLLHARHVRVGVIDARQVSWLEEAHAALPVESPQRCRVLARLATALQPADDPAIANAHATTALRDARAIGDDRLIIDVLDMGALGQWGAPRSLRVAWCEELRERALALGDTPRALTATGLLGTWSIESGDLGGFATRCAQNLALVENAPHPRLRWEPLLTASCWACALGRFAESDRYVTEVAQIAAMIDDPALAVAQVFHEAGRAKLRRRTEHLLALLPRLDDAARDLRRGSLVAAATRASCYARLGDVASTRAELDQMGSQLRQLEPDLEILIVLAEALVLAGGDADRRWLRDRLAGSPYSDIYSGGVAFMYEGTTERAVGLLDAALGDLAAAAARLRAAHARAVEHGLRPWIAQLAHELAQVQVRRGRDARELVGEAVRIGGELGIAGFGQLPGAPANEPIRISRTADVWTIERGTAVARIKDSRGAQLLARLIERPGEDIHVLALASDEAVSAPESTAGDLLDDQARRAYKQRLAQLDELIAIAEQRGDTQAFARHDAERESLVRELARATGLGGRKRAAGSGTERARVNVQRRLKETIERIAEVEPRLGAYLETSVRTGTYCSFRP